MIDHSIFARLCLRFTPDDIRRLEEAERSHELKSCPFVDAIRDKTPRRVDDLVGGALLVMGDRYWSDPEGLMKSDPEGTRGTVYFGDFVRPYLSAEIVSGEIDRP